MDASKSLRCFRLQDAALLLESRDIAINDAGQVTTTVHRVAWIGTAAGLRAHADLRVPWNSATCTFEVAKLRTWREGRWWPDAERINLEGEDIELRRRAIREGLKVWRSGLPSP